MKFPNTSVTTQFQKKQQSRGCVGSREDVVGRWWCEWWLLCVVVGGIREKKTEAIVDFLSFCIL